MKQHMGGKEDSVNKEGAPKVPVYDLSFLPSPPRPEDSERPRLVDWLNCSSMEEATFTRCLKRVFLIAFTLAVTNVIALLLTLHRPRRKPLTWMYVYYQISWTGSALLVVFAAAVVVGVAMKKTLTKSASSAAPKREEVKTISALLQQV